MLQFKSRSFKDRKEGSPSVPQMATPEISTMGKVETQRRGTPQDSDENVSAVPCLLKVWGTTRVSGDPRIKETILINYLNNA